MVVAEATSLVGVSGGLEVVIIDWDCGRSRERIGNGSIVGSRSVIWGGGFVIWKLAV